MIFGPGRTVECLTIGQVVEALAGQYHLEGERGIYAEALVLSEVAEGAMITRIKKHPIDLVPQTDIN
ncbi:hypothetical protein, partial [Cognatiyoonia sp. IB215182]|uniref:hypothetical protein n=1 Tax=Cognatiyoonia sp. IB215182 TaxID=3097353 RepID=UPI002A0D86F6